MNYIQQLNHNTLNVQDLKYEAMSFLKITENYFGLTPDMAARTDYIFRKTWKSKPYTFHNVRYENVILGIVLYVIDEFYDSIDVEYTMQSNSISKFVDYLYTNNNSKSNIIQIYRIRDTIKDLKI